MQGTAILSKPKRIVLILVGILAIGSMIAAPDGSVGEMFARMSGNIEGAKNLKVSRPKPFPELSFQDEQGVKQLISAYHGKVVIVNFWALWCAPCKIEKPKLDTLQADYPNIKIISLSHAGDDTVAIRQYFTQYRIRNLSVAKDPEGTAFRALQLRGLPSTIILNKDGEEVARGEGAVDWDAPTVRQFIESLL